MSEPTSWKEKLAARIPEEMGREIDIFETQIGLRKQGKIDEKIFAETRLRRGVYGQRYDNGQRYDGTRTRPVKMFTEHTTRHQAKPATTPRHSQGPIPRPRAPPAAADRVSLRPV